MNNKPIVRRAITSKQSRGGNAFLPTGSLITEWAKQSVHPTCLLHSKAAHQSGAVLIVSLIMLLLLTIIGVTGSQVTGLEEKMAGNSKDYNLAFQAAESALRAGEATTAGSPTLYVKAKPTDPIDWKNAAVTNYLGGTLKGVQAPAYIIELLPSTSGTGTCPGASLESGTTDPCPPVTWYRITARGTGGTLNAVVLLQSIYKR